MTSFSYGRCGYSSVASVYVSEQMFLALPHEGYDTDPYRMLGAAPTMTPRRMRELIRAEIR
jgi:hypothetical protein